VVPENDSGTRGQDARQKDRVPTALIGHQPKLWQRFFACSHLAPIAHRVTNDVPENAPSARLRMVRDTIQKAAARSDSSAAQITLIAVSKMHAAEAICPLLDAGHRVFGENRVQEAAAKWPELRVAYEGVELHLIGQLQSNKAAEAVALFTQLRRQALHAAQLVLIHPKTNEYAFQVLFP
jgi:HEAT repeat protein